MTTTQLQYFIMAARTLNFTLAAERVFTTQPALSRQIAALEQELEVSLFRRSNNVVELTEVGRFFYEKVSHMYDDYQQLVQDTRDLDAGIEGHISIGLLEDQLMDPKLTHAIHQLMLSHPRAMIDIQRNNYCDLIEFLDQGILDIAQASAYEGLSDSIYHILPLSVESLCLAVNHNYITVEKTHIKAEELSDTIGEYPIMAVSSSVYPEPLRKNLPQLTLPNVRYVNTISSIPLYLTTGIAVSIANGSNLLRIDPNVQLIAIEDVPPVTQGAIWCRSNTNPLLEQLKCLLAES